MIGIYKIDENRVSMMKGAERFSFVMVFLIMFLGFLVIGLLKKDQENVPYFALVIMFATIILVGVVINYFWRGPLYNTEIEVTDQRVTRRGNGLVTANLKFDDISHASTRKTGTLFFRKGIMSNVDYYTNKYVLSGSRNILFVPIAMENYDVLVQHIKQKSNLH